MERNNHVIKSSRLFSKTPGEVAELEANGTFLSPDGGPEWEGIVTMVRGGLCSWGQPTSAC